jgi:DNA-directed RNA polymerase sigma subunit (sigma70/sigma32)
MRALKEELVISDSKECSVEFQNYQQLLEDGLKNLDATERKVIFLRFWGPYTIGQIATELRMSWDSTDKLIDQAIRKLRESFREHKYYRRPIANEMEGT